MPTISAQSNKVYKCTVCNRSIKVPANTRGLEMVSRCVITSNCLGKMQRDNSVTSNKNVSEFPPEVAGLVDWSARSVLFTYVQQVASTTWNVTHNLENNPSVFVYINAASGAQGTLVRTENHTINVIDHNRLQILFEHPQSGTVQCVAMSSQIAVTPSTAALMKSNATTRQITHRGEITLATLDPSPLIEVGTIYTGPASPQPIIMNYTNIEIGPQELSPWAGTSYAIINGKKYYTRSLNIAMSYPAPVVFSSGLIANTTTVCLPKVTQQGKVLVLLSSAPHAAVDRVHDQYIDAVALQTNNNQMYYQTGELYVTTSIIKNTYPPISVG